MKRNYFSSITITLEILHKASRRRFSPRHRIRTIDIQAIGIAGAISSPRNLIENRAMEEKGVIASEAWPRTNMIQHRSKHKIGFRKTRPICDEPKINNERNSASSRQSMIPYW